LINKLCSPGVTALGTSKAGLNAFLGRVLAPCSTLFSITWAAYLANKGPISSAWPSQPPHFFSPGCTTSGSTPLPVSHLGSVSFPEPRWPAATATAHGTLSPDLTQGLPKLAGPGVSPLLVGALIDVGVARFQQNKFNEKYGAAWVEVRDRWPTNLPELLGTRARNALQTHPDLGALYSESGPSHLESEVIAFGFNRFCTADEDVLAKLGLRLALQLVDPAGKVEMRGTGWARSADAYILDHIASTPELLPQLLIQILDSFSDEPTAFLNARMVDRD